MVYRIIEVFLKVPRAVLRKGHLYVIQGRIEVEASDFVITNTILVYY